MMPIKIHSSSRVPTQGFGVDRLRSSRSAAPRPVAATSRYGDVFSVILIVILSVRPVGFYKTNFHITDLVAPFLILFCLAYFRRLQKLMVLCVAVVLYIAFVEFATEGFERFTLLLKGVRTWVYLGLFVACGKLFACEGLRRSLTPARLLVLGGGLWLAVTGGVILEIWPISDLFKGESDSLNRLMIPTPFFLLLAVLNIDLMKPKFRPALHVAIGVFWVVFFLANPQRQLFVLVAFAYMALYVRWLSMPKLLLTVSVLFCAGWAAVSNNEYLESRIIELIYFYNSLSVWVRINETMWFLDQVYSSVFSGLFGLGVGYTAYVPRFVLTEDYDVIVGGDVFTTQVYDHYLFHSADSLISILSVEGGAILLGAGLVYLFWHGCVLLRRSRRLGLIYFWIVVSVGITSTHLVTNPIFAFFLSFLYYRGKAIEEGRRNLYAGSPSSLRS